MPKLTTISFTYDAGLEWFRLKLEREEIPRVGDVDFLFSEEEALLLLKKLLTILSKEVNDDKLRGSIEDGLGW